MGSSCRPAWRSSILTSTANRSAPRRVRSTKGFPSLRPMASSSPVGTTRPATVRPWSSSTEQEATGPGRSRTRSFSPATVSASSSTTPAVEARATAARSGSAGAGRRTSLAHSRSCASVRTSIPSASAGSAFSRGADVLSQFAAKGKGLKAVVSDGATGGSFADYRNVGEEAEGAPFYLMMYTAARVFSGGSPGKPLKDLVARIAPTPLLLIATGGSLPVERDFNRIYFKAAREPVELWDPPHVDHTAAIRQRPDEYERRVVGFLDAALLDTR